MNPSERKPELLAPAGGMEHLVTAIRYGADAVYMGGTRYGLRAFAANFGSQELKEAVDYAHGHGARAYVTLNIFAYDDDLDGCLDFARELERIGVDAAIVSDPGLVRLLRRELPGLPLHMSTQANTTNAQAALLWHELGATRVILAREVSLERIAAMRRALPASLSLEAFVHGAMCVSYSGRCVLSNHLTGRDANQGQCAQACRWRYALVEEKRPDEYLPIAQDERGTYIYSAKDLCMIEHIDDLVRAGIDSFKIEGRMKTDYYVATVVNAYRRAIDSYLANPVGWTLDAGILREVKRASHRKSGTGFYYGMPEDPPGDVTYRRDAVFIARVIERLADGRALVEQRNRFKVGETLCLLSPKGTFDFVAADMRNEDGDAIDVAPHPLMRVTMRVPEAAQVGDYIRRDQDGGEIVKDFP